MTGRYALFSGEHNYPGGGACDLIGVFPDLESATAAYWWRKDEAWSAEEYWGHIMDLDTLGVYPLPYRHRVQGKYSIEDMNAERERMAAREFMPPMDKKYTESRKSNRKELLAAIDAVLQMPPDGD